MIVEDSRRAAEPNSHSLLIFLGYAKAIWPTVRISKSSHWTADTGKFKGQAGDIWTS